MTVSHGLRFGGVFSGNFAHLEHEWARFDRCGVAQPLEQPLGTACEEHVERINEPEHHKGEYGEQEEAADEASPEPCGGSDAGNAQAEQHFPDGLTEDALAKGEIEYGDDAHRNEGEHETAAQLGTAIHHRRKGGEIRHRHGAQEHIFEW